MLHFYITLESTNKLSSHIFPTNYQIQPSPQQTAPTIGRHHSKQSRATIKSNSSNLVTTTSHRRQSPSRSNCAHQQLLRTRQPESFRSLWSGIACCSRTVYKKRTSGKSLFLLLFFSCQSSNLLQGCGTAACKRSDHNNTSTTYTCCSESNKKNTITHIAIRLSIVVDIVVASESFVAAIGVHATLEEI